MVFGAGPRATRDRRTGARAVSSPPLAAHILRAAGQIALGTESDVPGGCVVVVPNMCRLRWEEAVDWMIQTGTHTTVHEWAPTEWLCFRAFAARGQNASRWWVSVPGTQHGSRPTLSVAAFDGRTRGVPLARRRRHRPTRSLRGTPHTAADSGRRTAERH
ncbi:MAG: hypothetical protein WDW38_007706 [Sanguina aurantia]